MRCATHPGVETALRCSKCGRPICPKCMVETPVGARCPQCARLYRLPTFQVNTRYLLIAVGVGLGTAIVYGLIWGVVGSLLNFFLLNLLLAAGAGYATSEVISLSTNRKRGIKLATIAALAVVISYLVSTFISFSVTRLVFDLLSLALGIYIAVSRLR
ncbi:MAG: B-box zinc finger protein [Dehalococcoidales bacterium]